MRAYLADVHLEGIGGQHQPLEEQHGGAVPDQAISLHLAQPKTAVLGSPLRRLPEEKKKNESDRREREKRRRQPVSYEAEPAGWGTS